jgi:hypothetical protein
LEYAAELILTLNAQTASGVRGVATGFDDGDLLLISS